MITHARASIDIVLGGVKIVHSLTTRKVYTPNSDPHPPLAFTDHTYSRSQLYSAYMIPLQPPPAAPKKGQPTPQVGMYSVNTTIHYYNSVV